MFQPILGDQTDNRLEDELCLIWVEKKRIGSITEQQAWNMIGIATLSAAIYYCGSGDPTLFVCPAAIVAWIMVCNNAYRKYGDSEGRKARECRRGR